MKPLSATAVLVALIVCACSDQAGALYQAPLIDYSRKNARCVDLDAKAAPADPRLVAMGEELTRQDSRPTTFYRAIPIADGGHLFYVFASNENADIYLVFETDATGRRFTKSFGYGRLFHPCRHGAPL